MRNAAPLVTFTFDDAPDSAYGNAASILEDRGVRGTFYIAAGTCGTQDPNWHLMTAEQVRSLHDRGHEIGCHTFSHVNVESLDGTAMDEECRKNHNTLRRICGDIQVTNFAYPYGGINLLRKLQLQKRFDSCRGIFEGVNVGTVDLGMLKVTELYERSLSPEKLQQVLRETCERNGWLIFYTHDVVDSPSMWGCTPALFRSVVDATQKMGMTCVTVRDALRHVGYRAAA